MGDRWPQSPRTIGSAWREGAGRLKQAGVEEADANAELLLLYLLGIGKAALLRDLREPFPEERAKKWEALLARKISGEPVQYIVGEQEFYGRPFEVSEAVLIPRPETELLAEAVLAEADKLWPEGEPVTALDVGTGSGILAVTLAAERPAWRLAASDLSPEALRMAALNAAKHGVERRIAFVQGDLLKPFVVGGPAQAKVGELGILVSNPPYIPSRDIPGLQREVREHEPRLALDGGEDGLNPYRAMAEQLRLLPQLPRIVAWEVGAGQAGDVGRLLEAVGGWSELRVAKDYAGIDRHVLALRR